MKVAILEASHWHVPLYLDALDADDDISVVAVSDSENWRGPEIAARFDARLFAGWRALLEKEQPDFVFAFGPHTDMPDIARTLFDRGIPFAIEKPAGTHADTVRDLAAQAKARAHFVSVPLIFGFSDLLGAFRGFAGGEASWQHLSFRFIAGPVDRYLDNHCAWMLKRDVAGGGCTINLAVHFIDLFQRLTGTDVASVSARMIENRAIADVELYSLLSLENAAGQVCSIETGYTFPRGFKAQREFTFSLSSDTHYLQGRDNVLRCTPRDRSLVQDIAIDFETDRFYATFVRRTLDDYRAGRPPFADLDEMARIMAVIDAAYASHAQGGAPVAPVR